LEELIAAELRPRTLFEDDAGTERRERLMEALDTVNGRFGKMTAVPAITGFKRQWRARADMKSPAYTTRIAEVPIVKA
jgi:DNA polymerase V